MIWIGTKGSLPVGRGPYYGKQTEPYPTPPEKDWGREEVHKDWVVAVKAGKPAPCHFGYAGPFTEAYQLGNIALRVGHRIEWDPLAFRITNCREANQYLTREYRRGWDLREIAGAAYNGAPPRACLKRRVMKRFCILLIIAAAALLSALAQNPNNPFSGRWDMTVTVGNSHFPSWLEVTEKSGNLEARVQQRTGNVAPVAAVKMEGPRLIVTVTAAAPARPASDNRPAFPGRPELVWELTEHGGKLTGVQKNGRHHLATHRRARARFETGGRESMGGSGAAVQWQGSLRLGADQ